MAHMACALPWQPSHMMPWWPWLDWAVTSLPLSRYRLSFSAKRELGRLMVKFKILRYPADPTIPPHPCGPSLF